MATGEFNIGWPPPPPPGTIWVDDMRHVKFFGVETPEPLRKCGHEYGTLEPLGTLTHQARAPKRRRRVAGRRRY